MRKAPDICISVFRVSGVSRGRAMYKHEIAVMRIEVPKP